MKSRRGRWVNAFGLLKPGVTMTQAKTALQPFFHQMLDMEVREKAFARAAPEAKQRFLTMSIDCLEGRFGTAPPIRESPAGADGAGGFGPVDRLCERRESVDRPCHGAPEGDCDPARVGRWPLADRLAIAGGEPDAGDLRRASGFGAGFLDRP